MSSADVFLPSGLFGSQAPVEERLAGLEACKILGEQLLVLRIPARALAGDMRRQDYVREVPERTVRRGRLGLGHIEPGAREAFRCERLEQGRFSDDVAARHVYDERRGLA